MQGDSTILEPSTERRSAQDTYVGRRVAFVASDLTDDDVEELKQQGLTLMEQNEDGYTVFVLDDDSHTAADEEMAGEANTDSEDGENKAEEEEDGAEEDEAEEEEDEDEDEDGDESGTDFKGRTIPDHNKFREFNVHGVCTLPGGDLKINCELDVMTNCDRKDPEVVKHYMKLEYLQLQLPNCINKDDHKGHFVHRIVVVAKPTEEWRPKIKRMFAEPSDDSHPKDLTFQDTNAIGVVGSVSSTGLLQAQASYTKSKALSHSETEYGWSCAEVDDYPDQAGNLPSWSVKWTWNLKYWKGGHQVFNQKKPWKFSMPFKISKPCEYFSRPLPELPYFNKPGISRIVLSNLHENWAEWRSSSEIEGVKNIEWDVEVQLFTARLQKRKWSLTNGLKRSYEAETLRIRIRKRVTVQD